MRNPEPQPCRRFKLMKNHSGISETFSEVFRVQGDHRTSQPGARDSRVGAQPSELRIQLLVTNGHGFFREVAKVFA
jgi:hypothetical protein